MDKKVKIYYQSLEGTKLYLGNEIQNVKEVIKQEIEDFYYRKPIEKQIKEKIQNIICKKIDNLEEDKEIYCCEFWWGYEYMTLKEFEHLPEFEGW